MNRLHKDDEVIITAGKDKGKTGRVLRIFENGRVLVEGLNRVKKAQKPNPQAGIEGGIVEKEMPIHASNVMLYNAATKKGSRVGFKTLKDGQKVRYYKDNDEVIDKV